MMRAMVLALMAAALLGASMSVSAAKVAGIVVFGDVLSDAGWQDTANIKSYGLWYYNNRTTPYNKNGFYDGRPQNGQTWNEVVAKRNKVNLVSYASTGCSTSTPSAHRYEVGEGAPTLREMADFRSKAKVLETGNEAFVVQIGRHDLWDMFLQTNYSSPSAPYPSAMAYQTSVIDKTIQYAEELAKEGVKAVIVGNIPPIDETPEGILAKKVIANLFAPFPGAISYINGGLANRTKDLAKQYPNVKIIHWDIHGFFQKVAKNPAKYNLKITNPACLTLSTQAFTDRNATVSSICYNPQDYMYWTAPVPSAVSHKALAKNFESVLRKNKLL